MTPAMQSPFELHPRLRQDCLTLGRFPLCRLLLMNEARYPWCILVPERAGIREIFELSTEDRIRLVEESSRLARVLATVFAADKMNIAAIGNLVPQLHLHHVVRYRDDPAWPAPVWGRFDPMPYERERLAEVLAKLERGLPGHFTWQAG
jgi:diadenosine tetraphosphate (Ap4A) HIT family hydrolase